MARIMSFFGADSKVGVTMTCQAMLDYLAQSQPGVKKILLHLNHKQSLDYIKTKDSSIDDLKHLITANLLTEQDLLRNTIEVEENAYILGGCRSIVGAKSYHPQEIQRLIDFCEKNFDWILIDAGCSPENGLSLGALLYSEECYLITTQQVSAFHNYLRICDILDPLGVYFHGLMLNKFIPGFLPAENELSQRYNMEILSTLPYELQEEWQSELENESLYHRSKGYRKNLERWCRQLFEDSFADVPITRPSIFKRR